MNDSTTSDTRTVLKFPNKNKQIELPTQCKGTGDYPLISTLYSPEALETVPDIENATTRNKKWGAIFSIGVIPGLQELPEGPIILPTPPHKFFDADDLDALRARLIYEIDTSIAMVKMAADNPEEFMKQYGDRTTRGE